MAKTVKKPVVKLVEPELEVKQPKTKKPLPKPTDFRNYLNVFEFTTTLPGSKKEITFKPLTMGGLKKILTSNTDDINPITITDIFDDLFKDHVMDEDFDPLELYLKDREFLLLEMRKKSKGEIHRFQYTCPKCKSQSPQNFNFENISILEVDMDNVDYIIELTESLSVKMRYLTRKLEKDVYELWPAIIDEFETKDQQEAEIALYLQAQTIDEIITPAGPQENITLYDKKYLIENIPPQIYKNIMEWQKTNTFGPQLEMEIECPHCKHKDIQDLTSLDFFD